jgi:hypothetical protein
MPVSSGLAAAADDRGRVIGSSRQQLLGLARPDHLHRPVAHRLGEGRIERHELGVQLPAVTVQGREQRRVGQLHVGLVEGELGGVDRLGRNDAVTHDAPPRCRPEGLALPEGGVGHGHRPADHATVDMALEPAAQGRKPELPAVPPLGPEVEAGSPEPGGDHILAAMPGLEDAQSLRLEVAARILGHR